MKHLAFVLKLSVVIITFAAIGLRAATPDYKAFRGTGGILVSSNPPNGTIVFDGSGITAGALPSYSVTNKDTREISMSFLNLTNLAMPDITNRPMVFHSTGRVTNAFRTFLFETNQSHILATLFSATTAGDVIRLGAGQFNIGTQVLAPPPGVSVIGSGQRSTIISGKAVLGTHGVVMRVASSNYIADIGFDLADAGNNLQAALGFNYVVGDSAATNFVVERVYVSNGQSDAFYFHHASYYSGVIRDCNLNSKWDCYVQAGGASTTATNYMEVYNTRIISDMSGATYAAVISTATAKPVRHAAGTLVLLNCTVVATNANTSQAVQMAASTKKRLFAIGGYYAAAGTNSAVLFDNILFGDPADAPALFLGNNVTPDRIESGSILIPPTGYFTNTTVVGTLNVSKALGAVDINMSGALTVAAGEYRS